MNDETCVVVHCYAGDQQQVVNALDQYLHHECPVLVLSPVDSAVTIDGVDNASAGRRAYTGQDSLDRQRAHLELLLERSERWFLLHDSDSVCLEPKLRPEIYEEGTLWYNATPTARFLAQVGHPELGDQYPEVYQPPLFCSRETLERMLEVSDEAMASLPPFALLIDWYFAAMAREAGITAIAWPDGISRPLWAPYEIARAYAMVRTRGFVMLHSVKTKEALDVFVSAHAEFNADPEGFWLDQSW